MLDSGGVNQQRSLRVQLYAYQGRWIEDESRFKIACKARQIGFTFAATYRVVRKRLREPGLTLWLSASERQALEAMESIRRHLKALNAVVEYVSEPIEGMTMMQHRVTLPNGSRIIALPSNPDTVRGFAGDIVLDEFAFHRDAEAIWRAAFAIATRGFQLEIISTPNGARGRYYELAKAAGLVDFTPPVHEAEEIRGNPGRVPPGSSGGQTVWSSHWVDLALARTLGFVVDVESLRAAIGDEESWQQEYCCRFLSQSAHYLPPELVVAAEHPAATTAPPFSVTGVQCPATSETPPDSRSGRWSPVAGHLYLGVDIGRHRDLTVLWFLEIENPEAPADVRTFITRGVMTLERTPFTEQRSTLDALLTHRWSAQPDFCEASFSKGFSHSPGYAIRRCAIDASGMGAMLAEELQQKWGSRVQPVTFTNAVKQEMAVRVKRLLEDGRLKIPSDPAIRAALNSIKREVTQAGNLRFDAERTDKGGHADHFWALALALHSAQESLISAEYHSVGKKIPSAMIKGF